MPEIEGTIKINKDGNLEISAADSLAQIALAQRVHKLATDGEKAGRVAAIKEMAKSIGVMVSEI